MKIGKRMISALTAAALAGVMASAFPMTASAELSDKTASFMDAMGAGWNLGNTLDANAASGLDAETSWGNHKTTEDMIKEVHKAGFETIRIPVSWATHVSGSEYTIDGAWLARVKEVVDYAYNDGMYVIINIHHDNLSANNLNAVGYYPDEAHKQAAIKYTTCIWKQVAEKFKDYDERLIFETLNEPRLVGTDAQWEDVSWSSRPELISSIRTINDLNQEIVNTIRSGDGYNKTRYIMAPSYAANAWNALSDYFVLPTDPVTSNDHRIAVSTHAYTPYQLCLTTERSNFTSADVQELQNLFNRLKSKFTDKGIPVIMGETGITYKNNQTDCDNWASCYFGLSEQYDIPCILWDNNVRYNNDGESHGHFNRDDLSWYDESFITAIMDAVQVDLPAFTYGDLNDDTRIDTLDLALLRQYILGWNVNINLSAADVHFDGSIDMLDFMALKQYLLGWTTHLGE